MINNGISMVISHNKKKNIEELSKKMKIQILMISIGICVINFKNKKSSLNIKEYVKAFKANLL